MTDPTARFRPATRRWIAILSFGLVILCAYSAYDAWARNWLKVAIGAGGAAFFLYCTAEWWRRGALSDDDKWP